MRADRLDDPCPACERPAGDHTLREWAQCLGTPALDLPYEDEPEQVQREMRKRFQIEDDVAIADHVVVKSLVMEAWSGIARFQIPALMHEFQVGIMGGAPGTVARVLFMGGDEVMAGYSKLIADSAAGAVRAAARPLPRGQG